MRYLIVWNYLLSATGFRRKSLGRHNGPPGPDRALSHYVRVTCDPRVGLFPQYRHMGPHTVSGRCGENSSWKLEFFTQVPSCYSSGLMSGRLTTTRFLCRSKEDDTGAIGCHVTTFGAVGRDYRLPRSRLVHPREQASHPRDRGPSAQVHTRGTQNRIRVDLMADNTGKRKRCPYGKKARG